MAESTFSLSIAIRRSPREHLPALLLRRGVENVAMFRTGMILRIGRQNFVVHADFFDWDDQRRGFQAETLGELEYAPAAELFALLLQSGWEPQPADES